MVTRREFLAATPAALAAASLAPRLWAESTAPSQADSTAAPRSLPVAPPTTVHPPAVGRSASKALAEPGRDVAAITSGSGKSYRILQITDIHLLEKSGEVNEPTKLDRQTYDDCRKYVESQKPDLIVISGDWWHEDPHGRARAALDWSLKEQAALGVPWAFCWGNHDMAGDYPAVHDLLEAAPHSLYRGGATHGDYRIEVRAAGAPMTDPPALDLFFMNSSTVGLTPWQLAWYQRTCQSLKRRTPALAFFHIPLLQFDTLYQPAATKGAKLEKVCFEKEDGTSLPALAGAGSLQACFCGHDHINDYFVRGQSIDLVYGRATGHSGYGGDKLPKGAKLIEVDLPSGHFTQKTILADGTIWEPTIQSPAPSVQR